jgi:DNA-binding GntR family transcriptional regulator
MNEVYSLINRINDNTPARLRFNEIHYEIRRRIALLQYPPGKRLDIDQLAEEFNVSRTPIRSVLQRLEYQGLLITRHGVGSIVTELDYEHLNEAVQLRLKLAELIGELTPRTPTAELIDELSSAVIMLDELRNQVDLEQFARIDIIVHECNIGLIGNTYLLQSYDDLYYATARMWFYFLPQLDWQKEIDIFQNDTETRLRALEQGDTKALSYMTRNAVSASIIILRKTCMATPVIASGE